MKDILASTSLNVCSIASPFYKCDIDSDEQIREHHDILRRCAALAHAFDCDIVRGFTFWRKGRFEDSWQRILDLFEEPVRIAKEEGITIGVENESSTMIGTGAHLRRFLDDLGEECAQATWDPANALYDEDVDERPFPDGYQAVFPYMLHMHMKDSAILAASNERKCVPVGVGDVGYQTHFQRLKDDGYEGYVSLETHWRPKALPVGRIQLPGGGEFSAMGEYASCVCLENATNIVKQLR